MKLIKILVIIAILSFVAIADARTIANGKVVYRTTTSSLRINAVDGGATASGGAFIDGLAAGVATAYANGAHEIEIWDSTWKVYRGFLKAAGSGSGTLDSELISGWANSGLETLTSAGPNISSLIENGSALGAAYLYPYTAVAGALYKSDTTATFNSGTPAFIRIYKGDNSGEEKAQLLAAGANVFWWTQIVGGTSGNYQIVTQAAVNMSANCSFKRVLAPASTGATVVTAKAGTTYNWRVKTAGFSYVGPHLVIIRKIK